MVKQDQCFRCVKKLRMQSRRVAIIGGGPGGLTAAKAARECGLEPTVYERETCAGGVWREEPSFVWDKMRTNLSVHFLSFSDYPWQDDAPHFPNRREMCKYLQSYMTAFDLESCIRFNDGVENVERVEGGWRVTAKTSGSEVYGHVIVANGANNGPKFPDIPGLKDEFSGTVLHTSSFRDAEPFRDQRVLVIGNAFSGPDICSQLVRCGAKRVVNVIRRPVWYEKRTVRNGIPYDWMFSRKTGSFLEYGEDSIKQGHERYIQRAGRNPGEVCETLRIDPEKDLPYVSITDDFLEHVEKGEVEIRKSLARFEGNEAVFEDGERIQLDSVLCATGYRAALPFFDQSILSQLEADCTDMFQPMIIHRNTFPPTLPNLAFVGVYRGALFPTMELQARWACLVFSGQLPQPTQEEMDAGVQEEWNFRNSVHKTQLRYSVKFDDELAKIIGAYPEADLNGGVKGSDDDELAKWLWDGPLVSAHYRLCGPNADRKGALEYIRKVNEKVGKLTVEM